MNLRSTIAQHLSAAPARRISPVSRAACLVTFVLLAAGVIASFTTGFMLTSLPNILLLIIGILIVDVLLIHFAPRIHLIDAVQSSLYGILYLLTTGVCAVLAAYALQRLAFPLRDRMLENIDLALGFNWAGYAHWVDAHPAVQAIFHAAYYSIWP